ncbi:MAG: hypothetical protein U9O06_10385 [Euryarchaeota archaeon]|nr:hypothetical protein [Euryarchaeota archaeon]
MAVKNTDVQESHSDAITPHQFTDWQGGEGVGRREKQEKQTRLAHRNLAIGNRTELDLRKATAPSVSGPIEKKSYFKRLDLHNRDCWWRWRSDVNISNAVDNAYKKTLVAAFCGQLELNNYQNQLVFAKFMSLDLPKMGLPAPLYAFVVCALIMNKAAEAYDEENVYHPQRAAENNDAHFQRLEESLVSAYPRITKKILTRVYNKLSQGNPPIRDDEEWSTFVRQDPFVSLYPSYASGRFCLDKERPPI